MREDTIQAAHVRVGDLITYVGAFAQYRVLSDPEPCTQIPDRVRFDAQNTSPKGQKLKIRLDAKRPVTLIQSAT